MKRLHIILAAVACFAVVGTSAAFAAEFDIPIDTVVYAPEGSYTVIADVETPAELVGSSCVSIAVAANQESVHPNNDLIIETGESSVTLSDVEREPGATTPASGEVTLGARVKVTLHMGSDEVFSGGVVIVIGSNCTPPTPPTTAPPTTEPPTEPPAELPAITIIKTADPLVYQNNTGEFTITVINPGPLDLFDVHVTDAIAIAMDPNSDCENPDIGDLAVDEEFEYECSVGNLDGVSPFTNEATAIGTDENGVTVTDTDDAVVTPVLATTITQPPTTAPPTTEAPEETLPVTGPADDQLRGFTMAGVMLLVGGIVLLAGASLIGRMRLED